MDPWQIIKDIVAWLGANVVAAAFALALLGAVAFNVAYAYAWGVSAFPWPPNEKAWLAAACVVGGLWAVNGAVLKVWRKLVHIEEAKRARLALQEDAKRLEDSQAVSVAEVEAARAQFAILEEAARHASNAAQRSSDNYWVEKNRADAAEGFKAAYERAAEDAGYVFDRDTIGNVTLRKRNE